MANMMRNGRSGGCKCCNDWSQIGRNIDKRAAETEIRLELGTARPLWIDPRWFDPARVPDDLIRPSDKMDC